MSTITIPSAAIDMTPLVPVGERLRDLRDEMKQIFPERDELITQLIYALLTREHVLVFGTFGTGKTDLLNTLIEAITGAEKFSVELTKFMTEGHVLGLPDPKMMREDGVFHYRPEGGILRAHFAELDEIFDANAPLLRVLLGVLNERNFKRGRQLEKAILHTAVASTNGSPEDEVKRAPELGAVIDRFIFHSNVSYLQSPESRRRMYAKYLAGEKPATTVSYEELKAISDVVVGANQITDPDFIAVYDQVIQAYRAATPARVISDRRACKLLKLVEANAVLYGRYAVTLEDIQAVQWGIAVGGTKQEEVFKRAVNPVLERAQKEKPQSMDEVQSALLDQLRANMPDVPSNPTANQLVETKRALIKHRAEVEKIAPKVPSTEDKKRRLLHDSTHRIQSVSEMIDRG